MTERLISNSESMLFNDWILKNKKKIANLLKKKKRGRK